MEVDFAEIDRRFPAAAEYLGAIYILLRDYGNVSHTRLAGWVGVSAPAVTQAVGRLKRLGLVQQQRYQNVVLTDEGRSFAVKLLRRHYLVERLLVGVLDYPWDKADEEAKLLQSRISDDFADYLYRRLGEPQTCPHGNPMPGVPVEAKLLAAPKLSEAQSGMGVIILRITEEGEQLPTMLAFCHQNNIRPGVRFRIQSVDQEALMLLPAGSAEEASSEIEIRLPVEKAEHIRYGELPPA
ncbi:MAG TPA: metal-dependent transcriptional regulator [Spirochaetia bacterium]|nr:metal-dependent transcriptional regulator [Spirochaetia bacterium]